MYDVCDVCHKLIYGVRPNQRGKKVLCDNCLRTADVEYKIPDLKKQKDVQIQYSTTDRYTANDNKNNSNRKPRKAIKDRGPAIRYSGKDWGAIK